MAGHRDGSVTLVFGRVQAVSKAHVGLLQGGGWWQASSSLCPWGRVGMADGSIGAEEVMGILEVVTEGRTDTQKTPGNPRCRLSTGDSSEARCPTQRQQIGAD